MENSNRILLVDKDCPLQKIPGKGGWTFVSIPEAGQDKHAWFGWVKVCGSIDDYEIDNYHLMPMGNGTLFLPVKADIRKKIKKEEGDTVHVILYSLDLPPVQPEDFMICLRDEPLAFGKFKKLPECEQKKMIDWIYSVRNDEMRVERIAQSIEKLLR
ncbi:MAG: YdeI/OmpD-associated family protein [Paludibacter sp.]|nr:YdeI/OmpD-associated family protein [Paludibacter sp.]